MSSSLAIESAEDAKTASKRSLRIVLASWAPFHAGAEVAAERLAAGLCEDGHQLTVVLGTEGETARKMRDAGLAVRYVPLATTDKIGWWKYRRAQRELRRVLQEFKPDLIHANDLPTSQMTAQAAGQLGIPRICHHRWIFGGTAIDWLNKFGAERHVFVSQALRDQLCSESARLAAGPCEIVYDGLPMPARPDEADRRIARLELGIPVDKTIVLFAGQIIERKGVADLLHAWRLLDAQLASGAELVVVGEDFERRGGYRLQMEALNAELRCGARFVGFQKNVPRWLTAADACVVPSHVEPLGNATLEAMAHARPVIGCAVGGIPEMVVDGDTGALVPPHDPPRLAGAISSLLRDAELRARLGDGGRARCEEKFSLRAHVDAVVEQYRALLATCASTSA